MFLGVMNEYPFMLTRLHEVQQRCGTLTRESLEALAIDKSIALSELYGFVRFFHHFHLEEAEDALCDGPVCSLPGFRRDEGSSKNTFPCPGLCDQPVAAFHGGRFHPAGDGRGGYTPPRRVPGEEALFRYVRLSDSQRLGSYESLGGYTQFRSLDSEKAADEVLNTIHESGLCGRGGAAFPVSVKLKSVRDQRETPKYVVCNADEGEPATFKDRVFLHLGPHLLLEGMAICGRLVGASHGIIYLRYEYPDALKELELAIGEARQAGLLESFEIQIVRGAGSYVCGEETALLNSLEGRKPWPRERPPFPAEAGLFGKPTLVSNVETLAYVPPLLQKGAEWFRDLGRGDNVGTKIYSVSGAVRRPGNYELPMGVTARKLIMEYAGGPAEGRQLKAFTLGGISGGILGSECLDLALDYQSPQTEGCFLGSGGIVVLEDCCCVVDFVRSCLRFYEAESCGKCYPCRIGTTRLREFLDGVTGRAEDLTKAEEVERIQEVMTNTSACGLGVSVPLLIAGLKKFFADELREHAEARVCRAGVCSFQR
jgi:NADH:ubiquinone oxidoreductase subunit F (NADH-binding)